MKAELRLNDSPYGMLVVTGTFSVKTFQKISLFETLCVYHTISCIRFLQRQVIVLICDWI